MFRIILSVLIIGISFIISQAQTKNSQDSISAQKKEEVYSYVGTMPTFNGGGDAEFTQYLQSKIIYPQEALQKGIQGTVYIKFIIEKDGSVSNVEFVKPTNKPAADSLLIEAALKIFENCPKWTPGKYNDVIVRVRKVVPIKFKIDDLDK